MGNRNSSSNGGGSRSNSSDGGASGGPSSSSSSGAATSGGSRTSSASSASASAPQTLEPSAFRDEVASDVRPLAQSVGGITAADWHQFDDKVRALSATTNALRATDGGRLVREDIMDRILRTRKRKREDEDSKRVSRTAQRMARESRSRSSVSTTSALDDEDDAKFAVDAATDESSHKRARTEAPAHGGNVPGGPWVSRSSAASAAAASSSSAGTVFATPARWVAAATEQSERLRESDEKRAQVEQQRRAQVGAARSAQQRACDLCFVLDCTASMSPFMSATKRSLGDIVDEFKRAYAGFTLRTAFVGYRDFPSGRTDRQDGDLIITRFGTDVSAIRTAIENARNISNPDDCEDVAGGLNAALRLDWQNPVRLVIWFCDSPAHGRNYHSPAGNADRFPEGDPTGLKLEDIVAEFVQKNVDIHFVQITNDTDIMVEKLRTAYHAALDNARRRLASSSRTSSFRWATSEGGGGLRAASFVQVVMDSIRASMRG